MAVFRARECEIPSRAYRLPFLPASMRFLCRRLPPRGCAHRVSRLVMHNCSYAILKVQLHGRAGSLLPAGPWAQIGARPTIPLRRDCEQNGVQETGHPTTCIIAVRVASFRTVVSWSTSMDRTEAEKNIVQLRDEIRKHDRLYYQDAAPIIGDREYDRLY